MHPHKLLLKKYDCRAKVDWITQWRQKNCWAFISTHLPRNESKLTEPSGPSLSNDSDIFIALSWWVLWSVWNESVSTCCSWSGTFTSTRSFTCPEAGWYLKKLVHFNGTFNFHSNYESPSPTYTFYNHNDQEDDENVLNTAAEKSLQVIQILHTHLSRHIWK